MRNNRNYICAVTYWRVTEKRIVRKTGLTIGGMYEKILMRGGMTPLDNFTPETVITKNSIGSNSGNLLYAYGVYRTLMTEDTIIDVDYYGVEETYSEKDIARINEEYDAYVCPLANAFRKSFEENLIKYANFFDKLTIPCYIIGIGLNAPYEPEIGAPRPFDEAAKSLSRRRWKNRLS